VGVVVMAAVRMVLVLVVVIVGEVSLGVEKQFH
jgi:hypothetical protein